MLLSCSGSNAVSEMTLVLTADRGPVISSTMKAIMTTRTNYTCCISDDLKIYAVYGEKEIGS